MRETGRIRRTLLFALTFVLVACYPYAAIAETQEPATPPPDTTTVAPETTTTPEPAPEPELTYTYNKDTGHWDSEKWVYNPATGVYEAPPQPIIIEPEVEDSSSASTNADINNAVDITNDITSDATSGDASVAHNTTAGNATTGDAAATATLMNTVNSTIALGENQKVAQFTQDIMGDVKGDIVLSPLLLKAMLEAQAPGYTSSTIDVNNDYAINNNMLLNATSGNAGVTGNTSAGNATTGDASAVANVVNILNSMIATQQSFIGTINIYGNLEGDILIAPDFIPQMVANNGGSEADLKVSSQDTQTIVNNISAVAESGAASVFGNTEAGNATTGDALSNVVIFNLSGHEVIAKNSLLVFVNVLGKWVGVIVDAPEGATAAMIGNEVTTNKYDADLTVNAQSAYGITNTIAVNAESGDATVANNTKAGNAVSGSAKAMANIANVTGSQFSASDWFGVLFINVFQSWHGSFGIDTPYGNIQTTGGQEPQAPIEFRPAEQTIETTNVRARLFDTRVANTTLAAATQPVVKVASVNTSADLNQDVLSARTAKPADAPQDYRLVIIAGSLLVIGLSVIGLKRLFG